MTAQPPAVQLHTDLKNALTKNAGLAGLLAGDGVYDVLPASAVQPYITLGESRMRPVAENGDEMFVSVFFWSRKGAQELHQLFHHARSAIASVEGKTSQNIVCVSLAVRETRITRLRDGKTWRGEMILRAFLTTS